MEVGPFLRVGSDGKPPPFNLQSILRLLQDRRRLPLQQIAHARSRAAQRPEAGGNRKTAARTETVHQPGRRISLRHDQIFPADSQLLNRNLRDRRVNALPHLHLGQRETYAAVLQYVQPKRWLGRQLHETAPRVFSLRKSLRHDFVQNRSSEIRAHGQAGSRRPQSDQKTAPRESPAPFPRRDRVLSIRPSFPTVFLYRVGLRLDQSVCIAFLGHIATSSSPALTAACWTARRMRT